MAETQIIERTPTSTTIRTGGGNGQRTVLPSVIPILPIRNIVVFPGTVMPLNVGRAKSKALLDEVMPGDKLIGVVTQRNADVEDPKFEDLYHVGVELIIGRQLKMPDGTTALVVQGQHRVRLKKYVQGEPYLRAEEIGDADGKRPKHGEDARISDTAAHWTLVQ